jgi:peroxiredoxin
LKNGIKTIMRIRKILFLVSITGILASCKDNSSESSFTISGVLENSNAKKIYLEQVPASYSKPIVVDSADIGKDGKFSMNSEPNESVVFNLRLDKSMYPVASVINDVPKIQINVKLNKFDQQFADTYEVTGSPVSQQMKTFMIAVNNDLQRIFSNSQQMDSLRNAGASDSVLSVMMTEQQMTSQKVKDFTEQSLNKATDPALLLFELGYYQSTANSTGFGLEPLSNEQVTAFVNNMVKKFPNHQSLAAVNATLQQQQQKAVASSWIGKEAPDFTLPDVNGKDVKLSSFRGKYVLVDFWASWCKPCRDENPNVVNAYNQYKTKNFTILGVSLDRPGQKSAWVKAIQDDSLDWTHVSDLKFWESSVIPLYQFEGIPFNVLVDPSGKVIAEALRGPFLEKKLSEVLN